VLLNMHIVFMLGYVTCRLGCVITFCLSALVTSHCQFILKPMSEITILRITFSEFYITIMCTDILLKETILRILHHCWLFFIFFILFWIRILNNNSS